MKTATPIPEESNMRSILVALAAAFAVSLLLPQTASAKEKNSSVGMDLLFVLPSANLEPLVGPVLRVGHMMNAGFEINGRIGYLFGSKKGRFSDLPVWTGARWFFNREPAGPYVGAEFGLNVLSEDEPALGANLLAGYVISKDIPVDLRLQLHHFNLAGGDEGAILGVGLSVGYTALF